MKISKLFHWLYAFLMLLPITFLLPTLAYYGFNDNAVAQEYTKNTSTYYETNEVDESDFHTLLEGNVYRFTNGYYADLEVVCEKLWIVSNDNTPYTHSTAPDDTIYFRFNRNGDCRIAPGDGQLYYYNHYSTYSFVIDFVFIDWGSYGVYNIEETTSCPIQYVSGVSTTTYTMGITESINQAIIDTFDLPMFSWTTNNLLVAPFNSICSFFGISADSVIIKYLYYWLTISVVWLVFDVLMYIPLLVHNYIDKARIE